MTAAPPRRPAAPARDAGHPSGDNRFKLLEATMKKHQHKPDALIEVLHKAQELFGFLEPDLLLMIAHRLKLPPSRVYGVATFYHFFSLAPKGRHTCVVCLGTACYVKGAAAILAAAEQHAGIHAGETTPDKELSLMTARCVGACGIAPVIVLDGVVAGHKGADDVLAQLNAWQENAIPAVVGGGEHGDER